MSISRKVDTDDDGSGTTGTVHNNAWLQDLQDRIDSLVGDWTAVSFNAANFSADAGFWTLTSGDVIRNRYQIINKTLIWNLVLATTTITSTPTILAVVIPTGAFAFQEEYNAVAYCNDNGTTRQAYCHPGDSAHLYIKLTGVPSGTTTFSASTNNTYVYLTGHFELS